jgi:hypothetical protein
MNPKVLTTAAGRILLAALFILACLQFETAFAQFDAKNPDASKVSADEIVAWGKKGIAEWKTAFGGEATDWNSLQMEFYKTARLKALSDADKTKYLAMPDEEFEKLFGGAMDAWKVEDMLFYSAIQDLKN